MNDPLLTAEEVAAVLRLRVRTVYKMIKDDELSSIRINGRIIRIKTSVLNAYLQGNEVAGCR